MIFSEEKFVSPNFTTNGILTGCPLAFENLVNQVTTVE
jgi:hypothetical protein